MQIFATLLVATATAAAVFAQGIANEGGDSISGGPAAIDDVNVNNGLQVQGSTVDAGSSGGNLLQGVSGSSFSKSSSNTAVSNVNDVNHSESHVSGNTGSTANGEGNLIGDIGGLPGLGSLGLPHPGLRRRDAVVNNFGRGGYPVGGYGYPHPIYPGYPVVIAHPYPAVGPVYIPRPEFVGRPVGRPEYPVDYPVGRPVGHFNHNVQQATIVQNQA
ncbi:hypothetical protein GQ54DRAFT_298398 [Martensiomyces pterosporus]|nr:hypothetical protein GQ54DRAFT_298398 [Martensiomyces pterosporus]